MISTKFVWNLPTSSEVKMKMSCCVLPLCSSPLQGGILCIAINNFYSLAIKISMYVQHILTIMQCFMVWNTNFSFSPLGTLSLGPLGPHAPHEQLWVPTPIWMIPTKSAHWIWRRLKCIFPPLPPPPLRGPRGPPLVLSWTNHILHKCIYRKVSAVHTKTNIVCTALGSGKEDF